jgi:hypothetical protein
MVTITTIFLVAFHFICSSGNRKQHLIKRRTATFDNEIVMSVPEGAPQSVKYRSDKFYVRSCYHEYYQQIKDLLLCESSDKRYLSVTGTSGIGKSIFYLYFLNRYRAENPTKDVITASFIKQTMLDCTLFRNDGKVENSLDISGTSLIPRRHTASWPNNIDCSLYLYDGPPNVPPVGEKMIAFICPNCHWLDTMRKDPSHCKLYMPTWGLTELYDANEVLQLNIDEDKIYDRYTLFGGSARYCLSTDDEFVADGTELIYSAISKISGIDQLSGCFDGSLEPNAIVHRLMKYIPSDNRKGAYLYPASDKISEMLWQRLKTKLNYEQKKLM